MDPDGDVFPGVTLDDLAEAAAFPDLSRPLATGGALPGFLNDAWNWTNSNLLAPAGTFLVDTMAEIGKSVAGAVTTVLQWILKNIYSLVRFSLFGGIPTSYQVQYPNPATEGTREVWTYFERVLKMPAAWIYQRLIEWGNWIWNNVSGLIGTIATPGLTLTGWLSQWIVFFRDNIPAWVSGTGTWVKDQLFGLIGTISTPGLTLTGWLSQWVVFFRDNIPAWVVSTGTWVKNQLFGLIGTISTPGLTLTGWLSQWVTYFQTNIPAWIGDAGEWVVAQVKAGIEGGWTFVSDSAQWLWDQTKAGFDATIAEIPRAVIAGGQAIGELVFDAFKWFGNSIFEPFIDVVEAKLAIPGKLIDGAYADARAFIADVLDPPREMLGGWTGAILMPFIVVGLLVNLVTGLSGPLIEPLIQEQARNVGARIPPFAFLRDGLLRGEMPESVHDEWLGRFGYDSANIRVQKALYAQIPSSTDLIQMAVKEAFNPQAIAAFGLAAEFPPEFGTWMAKQGFSEDWATKYWIQHWNLPSPGQVFEMLHRELIDVDEVDLYLKTADFSPRWRSLLRAISYNPLARVDARRMYQAGTIDRDKVLQINKAIGYEPADAEALTEWIVKAYPRGTGDPTTDFRGLTLTTIKQSYARRLIGREEALENLVDLDYSPDDAELVVANWEYEWTVDPGSRSDVNIKDVGVSVIERAYERRLIALNDGVTELTEMGYTPEDARLRLQLVDLALEERLADLQIDAALNDFEAGLISEGQFAARLADINVPAARIDYLVELEILRRGVKTSRLSLAQLKRAVAAGLLTEADYRAQLDARGYNARDIEVLVRLEVEAV